MTCRLLVLRRDESGGFVIFGLFLFVAMLIVTGLAVDMMRTENTRSKLQNALDRAVIAAADLDQMLDPEAVVEDYMTKAGLASNLVSVSVTDTATSRIVSAEAKADVPMFFIRMVGIDRISAPAASVATEAISDLEVSLVVDVSGSMSGSKIAALQDAANSFATVLLETMGPERISINIVPYSTQVAAPAGLLDLMPGFARDHGRSNCISFDGADFGDVPFAGSADLAQAAHFDPFYSWGPLSNETRRAFVCNPQDWAELALMQNDLDDIEAFIGRLEAGGNTSIDVGLKWGAALLDPSMGPILSLHENGVSGLVNPVAAYDDPEADKIIVLMTDGMNTVEHRLRGIDMSALSDVYIDDSRNELWVREVDTFDADGDGRRSSDEWFNPRFRINNWANFWRRDTEWPYGSGRISENVRQLTYEELFSRVSVYYNAYYHHYIQEYRYDDWYDWYHGILDSSIGTTEKNARLSRICDETKEKGIRIFSVGFEVNDDAALVMADCASSDSHFYRVAGNDLITTFEQIARTITELRLTQ
ncbi:Tad domain-containing protein [Histidinibacterium lentulum]|nr:Tad domain-containing protein [Histidinibacterium lentulum]